MMASPVAQRPIASSRTLNSVRVSSRRPLVVLAAKKATSSYVCLDCGYVYNGDFEALPSSYKCPVCQAPKRRFKQMGGAGSGNDSKAMQARKAKLSSKIESDVGDEDAPLVNLLVTYGGGAVVFLGALYFFLSQRTAGL